MKQHDLLRQLPHKQLKEQVLPAICMVISLALLMMLFTLTLSGAVALGRGVDEADLSEAGGYWHALLHGITQEQYESIVASDLVADSAVSRHVGYLADSEAGSEAGSEAETGLEMCFCEEEMARMTETYPSIGIMPAYENEIAVSDAFLERKGLQELAGQTLAIQYSVNGEEQSGEFIVSGIYHKPAGAQEAVYVSEAFGRANEALDASRTVAVLFRDERHLEQDLEELLAQAAISQEAGTLNEGYLANKSVGVGTLVVFLGVLAMLFLAGMPLVCAPCKLLLYRSRQFYGLLSTLGFQGTQLRKILRSQLNLLYAFSLPIGLLTGYLASMPFLPWLLGWYGKASPGMGFPVLVLLPAAALAYVELFLAERRAGTWMKQLDALKTQGRGGRALTGCALAVGMLLVGLAAMAGNWMGDGQLAQGSSFDVLVGTRQFLEDGTLGDAPLDSGIVGELGGLEGIAAHGSLYAAQLSPMVYGIEESVLGKFEPLTGELDWGRFAGGGCAVLCPLQEGVEDEPMPSEVTVHYPDGMEKTYEVMAVAKMPEDLLLKEEDSGKWAVCVSVEEWVLGMRTWDSYASGWDISDGYKDEWKDRLEELEAENPDFSYRARFLSDQSPILWQNGCMLLAGVGGASLLLVGILRYLDALFYGVSARKREIALLLRMGMTGRELAGRIVRICAPQVLVPCLAASVSGVLLSFLAAHLLGHAMAWPQDAWLLWILLIFATLGVVMLILSADFTMQVVARSEKDKK